MGDDMKGSQSYPEPPIEADVFLGGYERIDTPIDWLSEEWAVKLSCSGLGALFRLFAVSLRQSPAGSLPGDEQVIAALLPGNVPAEALTEALELWHMCSDGRRYWSRMVPLIEDAWSRKRGKQTKDAMRKQRERLAAKLMECGLSENGAKFHEVQDMVLSEMQPGERLTTQNVMNAATRAGVIGNVRSVRLDGLGQSTDSPGQSTDSPRTVCGQKSDSPFVSSAAGSPRSGDLQRR